MGRDIGPKDRQSRRIGEKLFLKGDRDLTSKSGIVRRNYPPGMHGPKGYTHRGSEYGRQLIAKQKIKKMYRLREKQFHNLFLKAGKMKGDASSNLLVLLESRFDNVIYRLGLATSRDQARQLVSHGHFMVNGNKINIPSYETKTKDVITVREKSKNNGLLARSLKESAGKNIPAWLSFDTSKPEAVVVDSPSTEELGLLADATLTIEFYSR
ncbi:30S ribosomal protein S4 [Candidatus Kuenenbacteria bacterium]|nr:30S ribosomal protein S4 [Candidatus Kuenenbacteria bacterium]